PLPRHGMISAEDEGHRVHEEDATLLCGFAAGGQKKILTARRIVWHRRPRRWESDAERRGVCGYDRSMNRGAGEILKEALALPAEARAAIADSLWDSLDQQTDPGAEEAWLKEIRRRVEELDSGAVIAIPWSEARARLLAKLKK